MLGNGCNTLHTSRQCSQHFILLPQVTEQVGRCLANRCAGHTQQG
jgi:hypothetical protein